MTRSADPNGVAVLAACLFPVVGAFAVSDRSVGLALLAAEVAAYAWWLQRKAWRGALFRTASVAFGAVVLAGSVWLWGGHRWEPALVTGLRILTLALPSAWLTGRIQPSTLGDALGQQLRLPPRGVLGATAALNQTGALIRRWQTIRRARRARGFGPGGGPVWRLRELGSALFALLVAALRDAGRMSVAMDVRGFATATRRSWMYAAGWRASDTYLVATGIGFAVLPWVLR